MTFATALLLMLHHTYILPVREPLSVLRWVPFLTLVGYVGILIRENPSSLRRFYWFDFCVIGFLGLALSSAVYSIAPALSVPRALSLTIVYVALFWGLWVTIDRVGVAAIISAIVYAGVVVFVLLYVSLPFLNWQFATNGSRLRSFLENANTVGLLVAFLLPFVLFKSIERGGWIWRGTIGLLLASLLLSQSRTGLGAGLLGSGYFLYHAAPRRRTRVAGFILAYLVLNLVWIQLIFGGGVTTLSWVRIDTPLYAAEQSPASAAATPPGGRLVRLLDNPRIRDMASLGGRIPVWRAGLGFLARRPLLGYGFGTEEYLMRIYGFPEVSYGNRFHSSFLGLALQVGIIGMLLFYAPLFALISVESRAHCSYAEMPERFALRAVILVGLVIAIFESSLYAVGNVFTFLFWTSVMLLGWIVVGDRVSTAGRSRPASKVESGWRFSLKGHFNAEIGWRDDSGEKRLEARIDANV